MPYLPGGSYDEKSRQAVEAAIVTLAACTYAIAFPLLFRGLGPGSGAFAVLPVVLAAWFWGFRVGIASSLMAGLLLNPILQLQVDDPGAAIDITFLHSLPYFLPVVVVAAVTGRLRDYRVQVGMLESEAQLRQLELEREGREKMEELLKLKSAFLNNMSHELRTPLTGILGFAEILSEEIVDERREFAQRIVSSGVRLQDTLNSILDLAQLEGGTLELESVRVDVGAEVRASAASYGHAAECKGLGFRIRTPKTPAASDLDRASLHRVMKSLIDNAIKFTMTGTITVEVTADESRVYIHIQDTGIGISEAFLPHMFAEFRQESTGTSRAFEGSGLGLSITKRLVELMGGCISVDSRRNEGSTFTVSFPRATQSPLEANGFRYDPGTPKAPQISRILVLDDNADTLTLTQHQLRERFEVETAADIDAAMSAARSKRFDAMVLDINLGGNHDGVDVLHALRELDAYRKVPVVALTAHAMPADRERFLRAGFDAYLSKPFTKQEITDTLDRLLDVRTAA